MNRRNFWIWVSVLLALNSLIALVTGHHEAKAQDIAFLITPYYGNEAINSFFDHNYPNGVENQILVKYDGEEWTDPPYTIDRDGCSVEVNCYDGHRGYDFAMDLDYERIIAADSGSVVAAQWVNLQDRTLGWGFYIMIDHGNGYKTIYAHLSAVTLEVGSYVLQGQIIGTSGNTGSSSGPHLHFEVRRTDNNRSVDPFGWTGAGDDPWDYQYGARSWNMWMGGEWDGTPIPDPTPPGSPEIIIDDTSDNSGGFSKGSGGRFANPCPPSNCPDWDPQGTGYGGDSFFTATNDVAEDEWAKWQLTIAQPGEYEVWLFIPNSAFASTYQSPITLDSTLIFSRMMGIDQYGSKGRWICIGAYYFINGSDSDISIHDYSQESINLGRYTAVDAVKLIQRPSKPLYVPAFELSSKIYARNDSVNDARLYLNEILSNGNPAYGSYHWDFLSRTIHEWPNITPTGVTEIVDATQDISLVSRMSSSYPPILSSAITGASQYGSGKSIRADTVQYIPILYSHLVWGYVSTVYIQNTGTGTAHIRIDFRWPNGTFWINPPPEYDIPARGLLKLNLYDEYQDDDFFGTGKVVSENGQPVAVVVESRKESANISMTYNALPVGLSYVYLPYLMKNYSGWNSCITIYNTHSSQANTTVIYYWDGGSKTTSYTIPGYGAQTICQSSIAGLPTTFSARVSADKLMVVVANQDNGGGNQVMSYSGIGSATKTIVLPYLTKGHADMGGTWNSGFRVQNIGSIATSITVYFIDMGGSYKDVDPYSIAAKRSVSVYLPSDGELPGDFIGAAVITSNSQNIIAVGNASASSCNPACNGDTSLTYNGFNR